jgi:2-isopropylmalate synthase
MQEEGLIYDWNRAGVPALRSVGFCDETLRDCLQFPSVCSPRIEEKLRILHLMESLGIEHVDIRRPWAGAHDH